MISAQARRSRALVAVGLLLLASGTSFASPPDAAGLVTLGQQAFDEGRYLAARDLYQRALELQPLPALYFNIAQCERRLGQPARAAEAFRRYLTLAPQGKRAPMARELLTQLEPTRPMPELLPVPRSGLPQPLSSEGAPAAAVSADTSRRNAWLVVGLGVLAASATAVVVIANQGAAPPKDVPTSLGTRDLR